jgi:3-hydroxyacyl-[acyl-carrier-protein] dehydratase
MPAERPPGRSDRAAAIDVRGVLDRLPHRYPFLFVDRILEIEDGKRIVALKNVTVNEPCFPGHFPGRPIFPGVLICEALVQAGGLLAASSEGGIAKDSLVVLAGIEHARFRRPVEPGDQLRLEVEILHRRGPLWKMRGRAFVDGALAAETDFLTMETKPD